MVTINRASSHVAFPLVTVGGSRKLNIIYGGKRMQRQTLAIAVETKNGVVQNIGRSAIFTPKPRFGGGSIKWYEDKPKQAKG